MKDTFRKLAAEKKMLVFFLAAIMALGVFFLLMGRFGRAPEEYIRDAFYGREAPEPPLENETAQREAFHSEQALEQRLQEFFSMVEGAGKVRVMVSPFTGGETVFAADINETRSYTTEEDSQGGSRETRHYQNQEKTVLVTDRQGTAGPLVIRETEPRPEGIVIIAEGGDNPFVRDALTRAARAVLGLETHMVQVLTMKN